MHVVAFTRPAAMLGSRASAEACPLSGPASTRNSTGSPADPGRPLSIHCPQTIGKRVKRRHGEQRCDVPAPSHLDKISAGTLVSERLSLRRAAPQMLGEGCCTAVFWPACPSRRSRCTDSTAATAPSYQPLYQYDHTVSLGTGGEQTQSINCVMGKKTLFSSTWTRSDAAHAHVHRLPLTGTTPVLSWGVSAGPHPGSVAVTAAA